MTIMVYMCKPLGRAYFKPRGVKISFIYETEFFNTPGLKIVSSKRLAHIHNNDHTQSNPTSGHLQINMGHSGHALNSVHVLRES